MSKITDKPLLEACANGDGTYSGVKLAQWLLEATTGKAPSEAEIRDMWAEAKRRKQRREHVREAGAGE